MRAVALVFDIPSADAADLEPTGWVGEHLVESGFEVVVGRPGDALPTPEDADLVVVFGSDASAYDDSVPWMPSTLGYVRGAVDAGTPVFGICFGGQVLARALGGRVERGPEPEIGWRAVDTDQPALVGAGPWLEFHYDRFAVPPGATEIARTTAASQAFVLGPHLGIQFHPEISRGVLDGWTRWWERSGFVRRLPRIGVDVDGWRAYLDAEQETIRGRAGALFDAFWARASAERLR